MLAYGKIQKEAKVFTSVTRFDSMAIRYGLPDAGRRVIEYVFLAGVR
jgi:hypothetical protein